MRGRKESGESGPANIQVERFLRADPHLIAEVRIHAARIVRFKGYYIPAAERSDVVQEVMAQLRQALTVKEVKLTGTRN